MISSPNAYFTAEEARKTGAQPVFIFKLWPYYFTTGLAAGSGTYTNCAFVAPDRVEVTPLSETASWVSPAMTGNQETWPQNVEVTWEDNLPGYTAVVEYRTASTSAGLSAASYSAMTNGNTYSFSQYYQWRVSWTAVRSFAFESEDADNPLQAYAVNAIPDALQSYSTYGGEGSDVYLETAVFAGDYELPTADVKDAGEFTLEAPQDFSDIVAGDHTLTLINPPEDPNNSAREARYSPGHDNFIFHDEDDWYLKNIKIYFGYRRPGTETIDSILLYQGVILTWGPVEHKIGDDGQLQEHTVQLYSRNIISYLLDCKLGVPESDGTPNPVVYGTAFQQADQRPGEMLGNPAKTAYLETGDTSEFDHTYTANGGTITASSDNPATGNYCLKSTTALAGSYGYAEIDLSSSAYFDRMFFSCKINFTDYPAIPNGSTFLSIVGGSDTISLTIDPNGKVWWNRGGSSKETSWYIDEYPGSWRTLSIGIFGNTANGILKMWVDGNEVYSSEGDLAGYKYKDVQLGVVAAGAETYDVRYDDIEVWNDWYPEVYQIPGKPYSEIQAVYIDGSLRVKSSDFGIVTKIISGRQPDFTTISTYPEYGAVAFTDASNLPSGDIVIRALKDATTHPVDIVEAILDLANCADYVDATSFAAVKSDIPDDAINIYADDTTAGDILREIAKSCLLLIWMDQDLVKVQAYLGQGPVSSVKTLTESEIKELSEEVDMEDIRTKINVKWGWYEHDSKLYYECSDDSLGAKIGDLTESLDLSWGNIISTESQLMSKSKADYYLNRMSGGVSKLTILGPLSWARLEIGDNVTVNSPFIRDGEIYTVYSKTLKCQPPYGVELVACKFLGEP